VSAVVPVLAPGVLVGRPVRQVPRAPVVRQPARERPRPAQAVSAQAQVVPAEALPVRQAPAPRALVLLVRPELAQQGALVLRARQSE